VFVNVAGRDRFGIVSPDELESVKNDLVRRFQELKAPDGAPATDRVWRSEEVFHGSALEGAPDVLPVMRDHRFELDDELFHRDPFSDVGHLPRGVHQPDGIVVVAGPGVTRGGKADGSVMDVLPTLLYQAGLAVPEGLDGKVLEDAFEREHLEARPVPTTSPLSSEAKDEASRYYEEEEALIDESLRGVGYL
jgi:predicted AlkP superfamily phosphohydrolase/phosphomutase